MKTAQRLLAGSLFLLASSSGVSSASSTETVDRVILFPRLLAGQVVTYDIGYSADTTTNTESNVAAPMAPTAGQANQHFLLRVEVLNLGNDPAKAFAHLRTQILDSDAAQAGAAQPSDPSTVSLPQAKTVEFTIHASGQVSDVTGLESLNSDERAAWQSWIARFGVGAALPEKGVKPGEKWRTEEPITTALLTGLSWDKESQYVDNEPCGTISAFVPPPTAPSELTPVSAKQGATNPAASTQEPCAVILTTATIKQKSPQKDGTPDDYKLHDLRTYGVAKGKNEVISYISLKTGIVVRASEDANQSMNVIVAKTDGSNRVHYIIEAQSHTRVMLAAPSPAR
jgi:hypothetical protein